ncbi:MAG: hypothetical protein HQ521_07810 [Bacteroidetes bacterium]|nr:hypothetical protein [Bacteroidota bacterium]
MNLDDGTIIHSTLEQGYDFYITDKWQKKYHFKISTFAVPSGLLSEAIEVTDSNNVLRTFRVLSEFKADIEKSELLLKAKIRKGINQKHLNIVEGEISITDEQILRGAIGSTNNLSDTDFNTTLEIDGKRITIEEFVKMLDIFGGFNFKFQIVDSADELD